MKASFNLLRLLTVIAIAFIFASSAAAQQETVQFAGAPCTATPTLHCPDKDCPGDRVINPGPVVEMKTRRTYFLDYPCDLKVGEKVTFILSLHGGGSYGNWQRHYFPIMDFKDKYRLVIATPNAPTRAWSAADDEYLQNIVTSVIDKIGKQNIKAFWLVGHSQGGMTSNRIIRTDFFKDKVDGWLSLSGGRLGGSPDRAASFGPPRPTTPGAAPTTATATSTAPATTTTASSSGAASAASGARPASATGGTTGASGTATANPAMAASMAALRELPTSDFSFIFETGRREMGEKGLPEASEWAAKFGCGARRKPEEVVDTKPGYVYDGTRQNPSNPAWGGLPGPGKAEISVYSDCKGGRVVADIVRVDKGHTEGLEPNITEAMIKLMLSAKGGKLQQQ